LEFSVRPGLVEPEFGSIYTKARQAREEWDDDLQAAPLTADDAARIVGDAERFIVRMERHLRRAGRIE
jgi:hypothetical protein